MGNYWIDLLKKEERAKRLEELKLQVMKEMSFGVMVPAPKPKPSRWDVSFSGKGGQITVGDINRPIICNRWPLERVSHFAVPMVDPIIRKSVQISGMWANTDAHSKSLSSKLLSEFGANQAILWKYTADTLSEIWVLNDLIGFAYGDTVDDFDFWFKFNDLSKRSVANGQGRLTCD